MKLFNINIDFKTIQKIFKLIIILFLVFYCIYILYFSSSLVEGFEDCSNCQMKPSSGDCIPIYDFSYIYNTSDGSYSDLSLIDTRYIFCPWEAKCIGDDYLANMDSQTARLGLSNEDFERGLNNITCCSNAFDNNGNNFYQDYTSSFFDNNLTSNAFLQCGPINNYALSQESGAGVEPAGFLKAGAFDASDTRVYLRYRQEICNRQDFSGILFEKSVIDYSNVLLDTNLSIDDIFNYQRILEFSYNTINNRRQRLHEILYEGISFEITEINDQLRELNTNPNLRQTRAGYTKPELQTMLAGFFANDISYQDISYIPLNSSTLEPIINLNNNNQYLLNEDQFFNCFGNVEDVCANNTGIGSQFQQDIQSSLSIDNIGNDYFGVSHETIKTSSELTSNSYGPSMDLAMEMANLQTIQPGGTAPVSVINQYLNTINGFYEKQIKNLIGPRTHSINDQIVFDNNTLETKTNTFLTYENDANNTYECIDSITNDDKFKYCGPTPQYSDFNL